MTVLKWILYALAALLVVAVVAGQLGLLKGKAPTDLGVRDGRLKAPSMTNNSVSSQAHLWPDHPQREKARITPLALRKHPVTNTLDAETTMNRLAGVVKGIPGAVVVEQRPDYLYAQFTTRWLKFVDDVEFWADPASGMVQVRSASRLGQEDMGVNRERVELIRTRLAKAN
jgi:uncharacterized protein (DUF1499 family)